MLFTKVISECRVMKLSLNSITRKILLIKSELLKVCKWLRAYKSVKKDLLIPFFPHKSGWPTPITFIPATEILNGVVGISLLSIICQQMSAHSENGTDISSSMSEIISIS